MNSIDWGTIWPWIPVVLAVVLALAIAIARGKGKELAQQAWLWLVTQAQLAVDDVTEEQVKSIAGEMYERAPDWIGPLPWKVFITKSAAQNWSWQGFVAFRDYIHSIPRHEQIAYYEAAKLALPAALKRLR